MTPPPTITETIARTEHEAGYIRLTHVTDERCSYYELRYRDGGVEGVEHYYHERIARADYRKYARRVGSMA